MMGDISSVNQYVGERAGAIPRIGCESHQFNVTVQSYMDEDEALLSKVYTLMVKLQTIVGRALLRRLSKLSPVL